MKNDFRAIVINNLTDMKILFLVIVVFSFGCSSDDKPIDEVVFNADNVDIQEIDLNFSPVNLDFLDENVGFVIDIEGRVSRTEDAGSSWTVLYSSDLELLDIQFLTKEIGFVLGKQGNNFLLLSTIDAGASFQESNILNVSSLTKLYFINANVGFVLGNQLLKTDDGGETWSESNSDFSGYSDIVRSGDGTMYSCGTSPNLLKSADQGGTWVEMDIGAQSLSSELRPFQNLLYLRGQKIIKTDFTSSIQEFEIPANINATYVYKENIVIGFGENYPEQGFFPTGAMYISDNSGRSWTTTLFAGFNSISAIDFISKDMGFALGVDYSQVPEKLLKIKIEN